MVNIEQDGGGAHLPIPFIGIFPAALLCHQRWISIAQKVEENKNFKNFLFCK